MDQAALQWVSLEQSSGAPCRTAWGAREQQKSACMVRSLADENRWLCNLPPLRVSGPCFGWHCWLLLRILQCTAGLSGTMTPWNVLNSSAIAPFNEPCKKSEDGVTSQLRRSLIVCCMISLSKCGVIILYGSMHFACLLISLAWFPSIWALPTAADYHRQRSIIWSGVHIFPYETRGPALCFLRRLYGWFSPGLQIFLNANTVCPPFCGGTWYNDHCDITTNRGWTIYVLCIVALCTSTYERTLREAIFVGPWPCTGFFYANEAMHSASISMFHRMSWWIINFGMFLSVTQW